MLFRADPYLCTPLLLQVVKAEVLLDVGGLSRDDRVTTEFGTGSLRHAVGAIVDSKVSGFDGSEHCLFECEGTERSK